MNEVEFEQLSPEEAEKFLRQNHQRAIVLGSEVSRNKFNDGLAIIKKAEQQRTERAGNRFPPPNKRKNPYNQKKKR